MLTFSGWKAVKVFCNLLIWNQEVQSAFRLLSRKMLRLLRLADTRIEGNTRWPEVDNRMQRNSALFGRKVKHRNAQALELRRDEIRLGSITKLEPESVRRFGSKLSVISLEAVLKLGQVCPNRLRCHPWPAHNFIRVQKSTRVQEPRSATGNPLPWKRTSDASL